MLSGRVGGCLFILFWKLPFRRDIHYVKLARHGYYSNQRGGIAARGATFQPVFFLPVTALPPEGTGRMAAAILVHLSGHGAHSFNNSRRVSRKLIFYF